MTAKSSIHPVKNTKNSKEGFYNQSISTKNVVIGASITVLLLVLVWIVYKSR